MRKPYMPDVLNIMRRQSNYGFVKESEADMVEEIIENYLSERLLIEKEIAYNKGFIDGTRANRGVN